MIVNRYNNFERLTNFDVKVGVSKNNTENPTCHDRVGTVGKGQALRVQCDPPIPGRYVSVQMFGEGILSLCEVAVYSRVGMSRITITHTFYRRGQQAAVENSFPWCPLEMLFLYLPFVAKCKAQHDE